MVLLAVDTVLDRRVEVESVVTVVREGKVEVLDEEPEVVDVLTEEGTKLVVKPLLVVARVLLAALEVTPALVPLLTVLVEDVDMPIPDAEFVLVLADDIEETAGTDEVVEEARVVNVDTVVRGATLEVVDAPDEDADVPKLDTKFVLVLADDVRVVEAVRAEEFAELGKVVRVDVVGLGPALKVVLALDEDLEVETAVVATAEVEVATEEMVVEANEEVATVDVIEEEKELPTVETAVVDAVEGIVEPVERTEFAVLVVLGEENEAALELEVKLPKDIVENREEVDTVAMLDVEDNDVELCRILEVVLLATLEVELEGSTN